MQHAHTRLQHLLHTIQTAAQAATKELHTLGAVGIWEILRRQAEKGALVEMLDITNGNQSEAARRLEVNRNTLAKRAELFEIDINDLERSRAKTANDIPWHDIGADIKITITGKAGKGSTTTAYMLAQTLAAEGFEVELCEACEDMNPPRIISNTEFDHFIVPRDLEPRVVQIRVGGNV